MIDQVLGGHVRRMPTGSSMQMPFKNEGTRAGNVTVPPEAAGQMPPRARSGEGAGRLGFGSRLGRRGEGAVLQEQSYRSNS